MDISRCWCEMVVQSHCRAVSVTEIPVGQEKSEVANTSFCGHFICGTQDVACGSCAVVHVHYLTYTFHNVWLNGQISTTCGQETIDLKTWPSDLMSLLYEQWIPQRQPCRTWHCQCSSQIPHYICHVSPGISTENRINIHKVGLQLSVFIPDLSLYQLCRTWGKLVNGMKIFTFTLCFSFIRFGVVSVTFGFLCQ